MGWTGRLGLACITVCTMILFYWASKSLWTVTAATKFLLRREVMTNLDKRLKSRDVILPTKICTDTARFFQKSHTDVRAGPYRWPRAKELMLSKCGVGEDSLEFLKLQGDQTSHS